MLATCDGNLYMPILLLLRVELRCKLQEKLHRVSGPLDQVKKLKFARITMAHI